MTRLYPWLDTQWRQLQQRRAKAQLPHALLLHGPEGIGKTDFAHAVAKGLLCEQPAPNGQSCGQCKTCRLFDADNHPDFISIQPEEAGKAIKIDQIRGLIQLMSLSSHYGGYRIVLIAPAEQMNLAASNGLLKTLEEPQAHTLIILVTTQVSRLPATIRSRCQLLRFSRPDPVSALSWLTAELGDNLQTEQLLMTANGAPLLARQMAGNDTIRVRQQVLQDLLAISSGHKQAMDIAAEWLKQGQARRYNGYTSGFAI